MDDAQSTRVRQLYRHAARVYDAVSPLWQNGLYREAYLALDRALARCLPAGGHVLELGCGTGANLGRLLALGLRFGSYTGVDFSQDMLARATLKFAHLASTRFQRLDLMADPLPGGPFDLIVSTWVLEHLQGPGGVVEKAWERLSPGGHIVLLFLTRGVPWLDALMEPPLRYLSTRPLREDVYRHFPGLVSLDHFAHATAAVAVLSRRGNCGEQLGGG